LRVLSIPELLLVAGGTTDKQQKTPTPAPTPLPSAQGGPANSGGSTQGTMSAEPGLGHIIPSPITVGVPIAIYGAVSAYQGVVNSYDSLKSQASNALSGAQRWFGQWSRPGPDQGEP